jgi:hypothetical protein
MLVLIILDVKVLILHFVLFKSNYARDEEGKNADQGYYKSQLEEKSSFLIENERKFKRKK